MLLGKSVHANLFDDFDGNGNFSSTNGPNNEDSGDFAFHVSSSIDGTSVALGKTTGGPTWTGRSPYVYFSLDQADVDADYTITVKGRGIFGAVADTGSEGEIWILFQGDGAWNDGNWYKAGDGNHQIGTDDANGPLTFLNGGEPLNGWYYLRLIVDAGGNLVTLESSTDGSNWTTRASIFDLTTAGSGRNEFQTMEILWVS